MNLTYRTHSTIEALGVNECTLRRMGLETAWWWELWFNVLRETDGVAEDFAVPVAPGGTAAETPDRPGGHTWGFTQTAPGTWQVSPSINVLDTRDVHPGPHPTFGSLWHQTPTIVGVPQGEPWLPD